MKYACNEFSQSVSLLSLSPSITGVHLTSMSSSLEPSLSKIKQPTVVSSNCSLASECYVINQAMVYLAIATVSLASEQFYAISYDNPYITTFGDIIHVYIIWHEASSIIHQRQSIIYQNFIKSSPHDGL